MQEHFPNITQQIHGRACTTMQDPFFFSLSMAFGAVCLILMYLPPE